MRVAQAASIDLDALYTLIGRHGFSMTLCGVPRAYTQHVQKTEWLNSKVRLSWASYARPTAFTEGRHAPRFSPARWQRVSTCVLVSVRLQCHISDASHHLFKVPNVWERRKMELSSALPLSHFGHCALCTCSDFKLARGVRRCLHIDEKKCNEG